MSLLPEHLKYARSHEWVQVETNNLLRVGITDFAQKELGDLVYVTMPQIGQRVVANATCVVIESVKTASDISSPASGEVIAINDAVVENPEIINDDAYASWLFCIKADDLSDLDKLLSSTDYKTMITA